MTSVLELERAKHKENMARFKEAKLPKKFPFRLTDQGKYKDKVYQGYFIKDTKFAIKVIKAWTGKAFVACDTETARFKEYAHIEEAALSPHLSDIRLITLVYKDKAVAIDMHAVNQKALAKPLQNLFKKTPVAFHNSGFDYKVLRKYYGVRDYKALHCTRIMSTGMLQAYYPFFKPASLKAMCEMLLGIKMNKEAGASDWAQPLNFEQVVYALRDSVAVYKLFFILRRKIKALKMGKVYQVNRLAQIPLAEMELNGINFKKQEHQNNLAQWRVDLGKATRKVERMLGISGVTNAKMGKYFSSTLSKEELAEWPKTPKGKLKTDAGTLLEYDYTPVVKPFAEQQLLKTLCTRSGTNIVEVINPKTKKLHAHYHCFGADTGRLSCSKPNLQQSTTKEEYRACFIPSAGYTFVDADYSQIEVRIMAEYAQEEKMLKAFELGLDIYYSIAGEMLDKKIKNVTKEERKGVKPIVLGLQFGMGVIKVVKNARKQYDIVMTEAEGWNRVNTYRKVYPAVHRFQMKQVANCENNNYRGYTKLGKVKKMTDKTYYGASMNIPIQGTAAECLLIALWKIHKEIQKYPDQAIRLVATIHDEIILECLPKYIEISKKILKACMVNAYVEVMGVGIRTLNGLVEPKVGNSWAAAK